MTFNRRILSLAPNIVRKRLKRSKETFCRITKMIGEHFLPVRMKQISF